MSKINFYLIAFFGILTHGLILDLSWPKVAVLGALLLKLCFDAEQILRHPKESQEPLKAEIEKMRKELAEIRTTDAEKLQKQLKDLKEQLMETEVTLDTRIVKNENAFRMANFKK